jgi:hypothetical protein
MDGSLAMIRLILALMLVTAPSFAATPTDWRVWSFARNFGLGDETEGLHFVWVLSLGEEFREDVGLGGIQEKFWPALA